MSDRTLHIAILGAATAAGRELLPVLEERDFPVGDVRLFGHGDEIGEKIEFRDEEHVVTELKRDAFQGIDLLFIPPNVDADPEIFAAARKAGAVLVDAAGTAAEADSPLIFPGINDEDLEDLEEVRGKTIVIPPPSAAQLAAALVPIEARAGIRRVDVVSLEAVSNFGIPGMEELSMQTVTLLNGREPERAVFPHRIAFNVIPQVGGFEPDGATSREQAISRSIGRLLGREIPEVSVTCTLVPVFYGTTQILTVATEKPLAFGAARDLLGEQEGIKVLDEREGSVYPMPMLAVGDEDLHVGRFRETSVGLSFVTVADNLRWGAVVPMVKVAELLLESGLLGREGR